MTLIRVVYEFGLEATLHQHGWVVSSSEPSPGPVFASPSAVSEALGRRPCIITERLDSGRERSLLLRSDSRTPFGLGTTDLCSGSLEPDAIYRAHHIGYLVGAVAYHCERMAESCATICRQYADICALHASSGGRNSDRAIFQNQTEPYYEFDAAITAARRAYDISRFLIWRRFGRAHKVPNSFARLLKADSNLPEDLRSRLEKSWTEFGARLSDYRDCIQHYVPVDFGFASASLEKVGGAFWSVRIRIPDNPEARSSKAFTFAKGLDALSYSREIAEELLTVMTLVIDSTARPL